MPGLLLRLEEMTISVHFSPFAKPGLLPPLGSMAATVLGVFLTTPFFTYGYGAGRLAYTRMSLQASARALPWLEECSLRWLFVFGRSSFVFIDGFAAALLWRSNLLSKRSATGT